MDYKKMMGYGDKKKVTKKELKPKNIKNPIVENLKKEMNEFKNDMFSTKSLYEGPAYEYSKYIKKIDKFEQAYHDAIEEFELFLYRKKGLKKQSSALNMASVKIQKQWGNFWNKLVKGLL